jgi:hypothetical protein
MRRKRARAVMAFETDGAPQTGGGDWSAGEQNRVHGLGDREQRIQVSRPVA